MDVEGTQDSSASEPSLRESLEQAASQVETGEAQAVTTAPETVPNGEPNPALAESAIESSKSHDADAKGDGKARDEHGRFAKGASPTTPVPQPGQTQTATAAPKPGEATATEFKAPQSWKATAREKWASLSPEVQAEVSRREREFDSALKDTAEARHGWEQFRQVVGPFEAMIRAEGANPLQAVGNLLNTAAALRTAPMATKGQVIAGLINTFGIPLEAINAALPGDGTGQPSSTQPGMAPEYRDPRVDRLLAQIEQSAHQRQTSLVQKAHSEVETWGKQKEFFEDVREEMADLLDLAAKRNVALSLDDAYSRAIQLKPDILEVLKQREAAKSVTTAQAATQRARNAASSVRSQPMGTSRQPQAISLREEIEQAALQVDGR